jgi:hypothetical protein
MLKMATVSLVLVVQGHNLDGGQSHYWKWNNAPRDRVYSFSVEPIDAQNNSALDYKAEVRNIKYVITGGPVGSEEMEVHFEVHNWGTAWIDYRVRMGTINP